MYINDYRDCIPNPECDRFSGQPAIVRIVAMDMNGEVLSDTYLGREAITTDYELFDLLNLSPSVIET